MIDSHCHLDHEPMFSDLKNVILRSKENGLEKILSICTTMNSFKKILEIIKLEEELEIEKEYDYIYDISGRKVVSDLIKEVNINSFTNIWLL